MSLVSGIQYSTEITGRRNAIINGNFDIWQRDTSQTTSGYGSDDRWLNSNTGSTKTHSQQTFTLGQSDVPGNPTYYSRTVVTSSAGAGNFCNKIQNIENVSTFAGETVTLSFWAKADAAKNIAIEFVQNFGTGGTPSATVTGIDDQHIALTTSWAKHEITVTLPSISGEALGTNGDDYLSIVFWFDAGTDFTARTNSLGQQSGTFDIAQVQLEKGDTATDFEMRSIAEELALCQRYYWQGVLPGQAFAYSYGTAGMLGYLPPISFPTTMRVTPSAGIITAPTYQNCSNQVISIRKDGFYHQVQVTVTGLFRAFSGVYSADAEI